MIRKLTPDEVHLLAPSLKSFFAEGSLPGGFDVRHFIQSWRRLIESKIGVVFGVFQDGGATDGALIGSLGAVLCPNLCAPNSMAVESFWYVLPGQRGTTAALKLLRAFEGWAKDQGCRIVAMIHLENLQPAKLGKLYDRMGYKKVETHWVREIV